MTRLPLLDPACVAPISDAGGCLVAVSGGADSVALVHALRQWSVSSAKPVRLEVLHVNHLLRGADADQDEEFVREFGWRLGLTVHVRKTQPPSARPRGVTLEEFLRAERHACFAEVLKSTGLSVLAVGHTADDMAETFLMHLMRGAGLHGLAFAGVEVTETGYLTRPLWKSSRGDVLLYLKEQGIAWREDVTNTSTEFTRNRVRHVLLPMMEREFNPSVRQALVRSATVLSQAEAYVRGQVEQHLAVLLSHSRDSMVLPRALFLAADPYIRTELVGEWIRSATEGAVRPGYDQVEQVMEAASRGRGRVNLSDQVTIAATEYTLLLHRGPEGRTGADKGAADGDASAFDPVAGELVARYAAAHPEQPLARLPHPIPVALSPLQPETAVTVGALGGDLAIGIRDALAEGTEAPRLLEIRNRRAGDWISPSVKLKSLLINDKVPWFIRDSLIIVGDSRGRVFHVVGMERINARLRKRAVQECPVAVSCQRLKSEVD